MTNNPEQILVVYEYRWTRHTESNGCVQGTAPQIDRGLGVPTTRPVRAADWSDNTVSTDGDSGWIRQAWLV